MDEIEAWLNVLEVRPHFGADTQNDCASCLENISKLLALARCYREAILAASVFPIKRVFPGKSIRAIAITAEEKAKEIIK